MTQAIVCNELTKSYKSKLAVDRLSFSIEKNRIVGLIGRNGAGKTTLLKACAGYIRPSSGDIKVLGESPFDNLDALSNLIFIDEEIQYNDSLKLKDILTLGAIYYKSWDGTFARKLLKYFGLSEAQKYKKLSRGMKTQFNIIMGLSSRSPITILDEPTLGLDAAVRKEFYSILLKDYMEHPRTIILSSHLMNEMENLLEDVILIHEGKLLFHKSLAELQEYAISLNGRKEVLEALLKGREVLHRESFGNSLMAGIRNDLSEGDMQALEHKGVDIGKVSVEDLYIWLTNSRREGGFDAFEG